MKAKKLGQAFNAWVNASKPEKFTAWITLQDALRAYRSDAK